MLFSEIYARRTRPIISFEVFPPKPETTPESFRGVLTRLIDLGPDFMTVTYGAFGSTRVRTIEIAGMIRREHGLEAACHLTCVGSSRDDIQRILEEIRAAGLRNIVALRGDPPQGQRDYTPPPGGYRHAVELVEHIRRQGGFGIAVAGYPEMHSEAPDMRTDLDHLKRKVDRGADVIITQLFYDNRHYLNLLERTAALGMKLPIVPGILPILSLHQVKRITLMCGATIPPRLLGALESAADDEAALEVGVRQAVEQAKGLLAAGAPGIHFYVLNKVKHMVRIMEELRPLLGPGRPGPARGGVTG
jgi:methylenetetrahydrofolate reductase (NADH)